MMDKKSVNNRVRVEAYARIHMGFFDLSDTPSRRFGSLGLSLNELSTKLVMSITDADTQLAQDALLPDYVIKHKQVLMRHFDIQTPVAVEVEQEIPRHAGLGSGTQMALAVGAGLQRLFDLQADWGDIAMAAGRGQRSGIGIGTFRDGGIVVDGGRGDKTSMPPIIAQYPTPPSWRLLLILDDAFQGMHGAAEKRAFQTLTPPSSADTQAIAHQLLMQGLPAIIEQDAGGFGAVINALQHYNGSYFAPAQGGQYASQSVSEVLAFLNAQGVACVGQSSWGPTGFALIDEAVQAQQILADLRQQFNQTALRFVLCTGCNHGANIEILG